MGIEALTTRDDGSRLDPSSTSEWDTWVSATRTRNHILRNPLIDWLEIYGADAGYVRDIHADGYDESLDFTPFIMRRGQEFEAAVAAHLTTLQPLLLIAQEPSDARDLAAAEQTFQAMCDGQPIIHQGVLRDPQSRAFGMPDFLVRSDLINLIVPGTLPEAQELTPAPDLGTSFHYVIVDAKFTTLHLNAAGEIGNDGSKPAYKAQLAVYNRALGRLQGFAPPRAFLLGRSWEQGSGARKQRGGDALERLGPVTIDASVLAMADAGMEWVRRVRTEGRVWSPLPVPSVDELWPNMKETSDFPWHAAKSLIGRALNDLTLVWQVGPDKRAAAHRNGITSWREPAATATSLGVGGSYAARLDALLDVNRDVDGPPVRPAHVSAARDAWHENRPLEFYVDFETVSDLADDLSTMPRRGGQPLIFMIGCGHLEDGEWRFEQFTVGALTETEEARIIDEWLAHMAEAAGARGVSDPLVMHWSRAEVSFLESAYNSARARHPERDWPSPNWFDLLSQVVRAEPVVVRGALGFGLKAVAKALHGHGLIDTSWDDSPVDGLGAMVGAWTSAAECAERGIALTEHELMRQIGEYNQVDCKVMMETLRYLRSAH